MKVGSHERRWILMFTKEGKTQKEIAEILMISEGTVRKWQRKMKIVPIGRSIRSTQ